MKLKNEEDVPPKQDWQHRLEPQALPMSLPHTRALSGPSSLLDECVIFLNVDIGRRVRARQQPGTTSDDNPSAEA